MIIQSVNQDLPSLRLNFYIFYNQQYLSKWNNIMSCFISSTNMTSPPALSQTEGDIAKG